MMIACLGIARLSWRQILVPLSISVLVLELLALLGSYEFMYSPLNTAARHQQLFHDAVLEEATSLFTSGNWLPLLPATGSSASEPIHRHIIIPTAHRKKPYLYLTLWSLFHGTPSHSPLWTTTAITLLNTAASLQAHPELLQLEKQPVKSNARPPWNWLLSNHSLDASWVRHGVEDYAAALSQCHPLAWCIILEDDALLTRDFLMKFHRHVEIPLGSDTQQVAFVKLFVSDYWNGFSSEWTHLVDMAYVSLVSLLMTYLFFSLLLCAVTPPRLPKKQPQPLSTSGVRKVGTAFLGIWISIYGFARLMTRQAFLNWIEPSEIHLDTIGLTSQSTVAMAYPSSSVPTLLDYIHKRVKNATDLAPIDVEFNRWLKQSQLQPWRTRPSLAQHMGAYSSASYKNQGNFRHMKQDSAFVFELQYAMRTIGH